MELKYQNPHIKDGDICEDPDYATNHIYLIKGKSHLGLGYQSCTTFLKEYFGGFFDCDGILDNWFKKNDPRIEGRTKEQIKEDWKREGMEAARKGTIMHAEIENYFNGLPVDWDNEDFKLFVDKQPEAIKKPFRTEMSVYSEDVKICGNIDFIHDNGDGTFDIWDWKRAKPFNKEKQTWDSMCKFPITNIVKNDYYKYTFQLNIYKWILERHYDMKIRNLYNVRIRDDEVEVINQPVLDKETNDLMNHRIDKLNSASYPVDEFGVPIFSK